MRNFSIPSGKAELAGIEDGKGPAIIFLHAGVRNKRMWRDRMAAFVDRRHVIAFDRRGFGETTYEAQAFSHVRDLGNVMDGLDIQRACLVGCSQGGRLSVDFALAHPQRVAELVLVAPAIGGAPQSEHHPADIEKPLQAAEDAEDEKDFDDVSRIEAQLWLDGPRSAEGRVAGAARDLFLVMNTIPLRSSSPGRDTPAADSFDRLEEIAVPTMIIWGDLDFPHLQERCKELSRRIKGVTSEIMPATAHLPNLEQPERFNELLKRFLTEAR
ncbi:MAG: alpha/beta fold hydrolase [Dongiaceae bacterium]